MILLTDPLFITILAAGLCTTGAQAQEARPASTNLPVRWEEMTAPEFVQAVAKSGATCIIPCGIIEKHGPHLPLGTDLLDVRELSVRAAQKEFAIVFPQYYFGQIFEAKHQPGVVAYSQKLIWELLQETCDELGRNGIKKIILVNGHGGNNHFLPFFCQAQLAGRKDYAVFLFQPSKDPEADPDVQKLQTTPFDAHAGEIETSLMMAHRPDLAHVDRAKQQSGEDQKRLDLPDAYTAIWWYARFPNHYGGDGSAGSRELGGLLLKKQVDALVEMIKTVKKDAKVLELQKKFFDQSEKPLTNPQ